MAYAPDGYVTVPEAARRIGIDPSAVRRLIMSGFLPAARPAGVWLIADDVLDGLQAIDRRPGRPTPGSREWRDFASQVLHEVAHRTPAPTSRSAGRPTRGQSPRRPRKHGR